MREDFEFGRKKVIGLGYWESDGHPIAIWGDHGGFEAVGRGKRVEGSDCFG